MTMPRMSPMSSLSKVKMPSMKMSPKPGSYLQGVWQKSSEAATKASNNLAQQTHKAKQRTRMAVGNVTTSAEDPQIVKVVKYLKKSEKQIGELIKKTKSLLQVRGELQTCENNFAAALLETADSNAGDSLDADGNNPKNLYERTCRIIGENMKPLKENETIDESWAEFGKQVNS